MRPLSTRLPLALALLSLVACDQEMLSIERGSTSTLSVRAYVDVNGNGVFDSADDDPIDSAVITAQSATAEFDEMTGADGLAVFEDLPPGGYQLSISGFVPLGTVLTGDASPVVGAPFAGASLTSEFRYAFLPAEVEGRLFRDDNDSGDFEPGEDLPAAGITVTLTPVAAAMDAAIDGTATDGPSAEASVVETSTDEEGLFGFELVAPGSYTLEIFPLETMEIVGGSQIPVDVQAGIPVNLSVEFTGTLLIDITDARNAAEGQTVTVEGVVTWHPGFDTRNYFLQDETAAIAVFDFDRNESAIGDLISITGTRGSFDGEVQISPIVSFENLGPVGAPDPRPVTADEINAGMFQGRLVTIDGTVEQVDVLSFGNQMVLLRDAGGNLFAVKVDSRTGVEEETWAVGTTYGVTGVLGTDENESGTEIDANHPHRVEVRFPDDVQEGGSVVDIADARGMIGETVLIQAVVTWQNQWDDRIFFFQDATGGMSTFFFDAPELQRGDFIQILGEITTFRGEVQISPDDFQLLGNVGVPTPRGVTGAEVNAGEHQGQLVTVTGTIQSVDVLSFGNQLVTLRDGAGTDLKVFVDSRNGVEAADWPAPGTLVRVTGVLGFDDRDIPEGGARIELRDIDDIGMAMAGQVSIAEARSMPGATLTVEGVVTWQTQWDDRVYFFQDETGGISTFHFGAPMLAEGDRIRVTGDVSAFRGETQLGSITDITNLGAVGVPPPRVVSGYQVKTGRFQGELARVTGTLLSVETLAFGNQRVTIRDALGATFLVFVDSRNGMNAEDWPEIGSTVEVTGVLGTDDRDQPEGGGPRLEPRRPDDVSVVAGAPEEDR